MSVIYKYTVQVADTFTLDLPIDSQFLDVQLQFDSPCLWVLHDIEQRRMTYTFHVIGTGNETDHDSLGAISHIGTFQDGVYVWHVFVELP